jgi:hydrogenase maturation protease
MRILVAGIGNIFLGDDAFGCIALERLARESWPDGVCVRDFGIRGLDLAYAILDGYDAVILIDALARGGPPGTVYVLEPSLQEDAPAATVETHNVTPDAVMRLVRSFGGRLGWIRIVGCEPEAFGDGDLGDVTLSPCVAAALDEAVRATKSLVAEAIASSLRDARGASHA